ncbi:TetR/AcrR family transcriptional regulator C-terminal domain-containing protein [Streptomyces sp. NPDC001107]
MSRKAGAGGAEGRLRGAGLGRTASPGAAVRRRPLRPAPRAGIRRDHDRAPRAKAACPAGTPHGRPGTLTYYVAGPTIEEQRAVALPEPGTTAAARLAEAVDPQRHPHMDAALPHIPAPHDEQPFGHGLRLVVAGIRSSTTTKRDPEQTRKKPTPPMNCRHAAPGRQFMGGMGSSRRRLIACGRGNSGRSPTPARPGHRGHRRRAAHRRPGRLSSGGAADRAFGS